MATSVEADLLQHVLDGDLSYLDELLGKAHNELREMERLAGPLVLSHRAVLRVLSGLKVGEYSPQEVQRWAAFVRAGFVTGSAVPPIHPLDIALEIEWEDEMIDILARLDESLDSGELPLDDAETDDMVAQLSDSRGRSGS